MVYLQASVSFRAGWGLLQVRSGRLGTTLAIDCRTHDSACIPRSFATREETCDADVLQGLAVAKDADRTAGACLDADNGGLLSQEAVLLLSP